MIQTKGPKVWGPLLVAGVMLSGSGCGREAVEEEAPPVRPVKTMVVGGAAAAGRSFPGRVEAANQVDLSFRVGGPLVELPINEGDLVRRGQLLARIDPRDFLLRINAAQAEFDKADADYRRFSALYEKDAASKAQLDQALAARDVAQAALDDAQAKLKDASLRAPFDGRIGERFVENFEDVRQKQPILSLVDIRRLKVIVDVPQSMISSRARLSEAEAMTAAERNIGTTAASFDAAPDQSFPLELSEVAAQADPRTQTYRVTFLMDQPSAILVLPGMTATVSGSVERVGAAREQQLLVPAAAVFADAAGNSHVWVVDSGSNTVHRRPVTTGELSGSEEIRIVEGLKIGETIAISAVSRLTEGMQVRPVDEVSDL